MNLANITAADVLALKPCGDWPAERIEELAAGRDAWSIHDVLDAEAVPAADRVWLALQLLAPDHRGAVTEFAHGCAERAAEYARSRWAHAAAHAAEAAEYAAAADAAEAAAAAWAAHAAEAAAAAAEEAAYAYTAAEAAERRRQIQHLHRLCVEAGVAL